MREKYAMDENLSSEYDASKKGLYISRDKGKGFFKFIHISRFKQGTRDLNTLST